MTAFGQASTWIPRQVVRTWQLPSRWLLKTILVQQDDSWKTCKELQLLHGEGYGFKLRYQVSFQAFKSLCFLREDNSAGMTSTTLAPMQSTVRTTELGNMNLSLRSSDPLLLALSMLRGFPH